MCIVYSVVPVAAFNVSENEVQGSLQHVNSYAMERIVCVHPEVKIVLRSCLFFFDRYGQVIGSPDSYLEGPVFKS
jgi:hypothetical protein